MNKLALEDELQVNSSGADSYYQPSLLLLAYSTPNYQQCNTVGNPITVLWVNLIGF